MDQDQPKIVSTEVELQRLRMGGWIVGGSIFAVIVALGFLLASQNLQVSEKVALLGTVTTFLASLVGVFFGVNSSGSSRTQTALNAAENNRTVTSLANTAQSVADTAARSLAANHAMLAQINAQANSGTRPSASNTVGIASVATVASAPIETMRGDPDEDPQVVALPPGYDAVVDALTTESFIHVAAVGAPAADVFGAQGILAVAGKEASDGVSRATNRARVTEYLRLLGLDFLDDHGVPTRFCAAGITWAACKAYCDLNQIAYDDTTRLKVLRGVLPDLRKLYFKPSARCQDIVDDAKHRGTWLEKTAAPKAGYLVFYNWSGATHAEHIGVVVKLTGQTLRTIEFNTKAESGPNQGNGGCVCEKARSLNFVIGYAKTY